MIVVFVGEKKDNARCAGIGLASLSNFSDYRGQVSSSLEAAPKMIREKDDDLEYKISVTKKVEVMGLDFLVCI